MLYKDNTFKFIAVLNPKTEVPQLMNALAHTSTGLIAKANNHDGMSFCQYEFQADWANCSLISLYPFIILKAKNNNQMKALHQSVNESSILHNVFTDSMLGTSGAEQIEKTKTTNADELNYFCIVMFGEAEKLEPLTRKFSLFKN